MGDMLQDDWVALATLLIGHFYAMYLVSMWTNKQFMEKYEVSKKMIRSFFAPPGWAAQAIIFCVAGFITAAIFLFWKRDFKSASDTNFALVMGFHFASVFLFQFWSTTASWGQKWWWATVGDSVLLTATSTVVWAILGVEKAWLPFGLYSPLPIVAFLSIAVSSGFAIDSSALGESVIARALGEPLIKQGNFSIRMGEALTRKSGQSYTAMGNVNASGRPKRRVSSAYQM